MYSEISYDTWIFICKIQFEIIINTSVLKKISSKYIDYCYNFYYVIATIFIVCSLEWHLPKYNIYHLICKDEMRKYMLSSL